MKTKDPIKGAEMPPDELKDSPEPEEILEELPEDNPWLQDEKEQVNEQILREIVYRSKTKLLGLTLKDLLLIFLLYVGLGSFFVTLAGWFLHYFGQMGVIVIVTVQVSLYVVVLQLLLYERLLDQLYKMKAFRGK